MIWNTYGPIIASLRYAYQWPDSTVAMMANWGTITFVLFAIPFILFMERNGLRSAVLAASFLSSLGAVLRACSTEDKMFLAMAHIGSILNGITGKIKTAIKMKCTPQPRIRFTTVASKQEDQNWPLWG